MIEDMQINGEKVVNFIVQLLLENAKLTKQLKVIREDATNWGDALNDASWVFVDVCPEKSVKLFNNTKEPLRAAILRYLDHIEKNT